ncbi:NAD(P)-dependent oxidoreductase [Pseudomaricurvus sp.]|uniref:NAD(P)-dependent oxidoreductase n=1 Tax=Pseudomaricurvus sp. TaxID=2004510 RepID=UPI003F6D7499
MKCGFIGLGSQGGPMAQRIIDGGYDVVLWARRRESLEPYANSGATFANSLAELAEQVQMCSVCVVDDAGVQAVCDTLIPNMAAGGVIVIHSTVHPELCQTLANQAKAHGLTLLDAPVSGGGEGAANGTLTVMVGGDSESVEFVRPVLETFASTIVHLGEVGAGQMAKLVNNSMMAANLAVSHYAIEAAKTLNIDPQAFSDLVKVSSGRSFAFDVCARMQKPEDFSHGAKLLTKDVRLLGESMGTSDPSFEFIRHVATTFLDLSLDPK